MGAKTDGSILMKIIDILRESSNLYCPNCGEDLGKDIELSKKEYCGNCGKRDIDNPRGSDDEFEEDEGY